LTEAVQPNPEDFRQSLIDTLGNSDSTLTQKMQSVLWLGYKGGDEEVPMIAEVFSQEKDNYLAASARIALENIATPAARQAVQIGKSLREQRLHEETSIDKSIVNSPSLGGKLQVIDYSDAVALGGTRKLENIKGYYDTLTTRQNLDFLQDEAEEQRTQKRQQFLADLNRFIKQADMHYLDGVYSWARSRNADDPVLYAEICEIISKSALRTTEVNDFLQGPFASDVLDNFIESAHNLGRTVEQTRENHGRTTAFESTLLNLGELALPTIFDRTREEGTFDLLTSVLIKTGKDKEVAKAINDRLVVSGKVKPSDEQRIDSERIAREVLPTLGIASNRELFLEWIDNQHLHNHQEYLRGGFEGLARIGDPRDLGLFVSRIRKGDTQTEMILRVLGKFNHPDVIKTLQAIQDDPQVKTPMPPLEIADFRDNVIVLALGISSALEDETIKSNEVVDLVRLADESGSPILVPFFTEALKKDELAPWAKGAILKYLRDIHHYSSNSDGVEFLSKIKDVILKEMDDLLNVDEEEMYLYGDRYKSLIKNVLYFACRIDDPRVYEKFVGLFKNKEFLDQTEDFLPALMESAFYKNYTALRLLLEMKKSGVQVVDRQLLSIHEYFRPRPGEVPSVLRYSGPALPVDFQQSLGEVREIVEAD
jgi:hypothetical protein